jgi:RND family efflux transporter MFP subunit
MKPVAVAIGMGLMAAGACSRPQAESRTASDVPAVAVAQVMRGSVAQRLTVAAEFRPYQEIDVHAKVAGYVKAINVDVGDRVHAGQLLAVLEVPELQDELRQDAASVGRAAEEVNRAEADLERAKSAHEVAHLSATRLASASKAQPKLIAQQDLDEAAGHDRVAEAQVATAKAAVAAARGQLDVAKAAHAKAETLVAYARIAAPFAGVITHRYADTGAMIQAGTSSQTQTMPLVRLSENAMLRLVIPAPESAIARIRVGTPVDVSVQSLDRTIPGRVARIADRLDVDTRTMRVEVDVPNRDLALVPGMYANASVVLDEAKDVIVAPVQAIDRTDTHARVLVVTPDHRVEPREVTLGLEAADRVQVVAGLKTGELIIVGNRAQLRAGSIVAPKPMAATGDGTE